MTIGDRGGETQEVTNLEASVDLFGIINWGTWGREKYGEKMPFAGDTAMRIREREGKDGIRKQKRIENQAPYFRNGHTHSLKRTAYLRLVQEKSPFKNRGNGQRNGWYNQGGPCRELTNTGKYPSLEKSVEGLVRTSPTPCKPNGLVKEPGKTSGGIGEGRVKSIVISSEPVQEK